MPIDRRQTSVPPLVGPHDAWFRQRTLEELREHVDFGMAFNADYFILASSETSDRSVTRIGGVPYWPKSRDWPISDSGAPIPFLAQFDLFRSRAVNKSMPARMLLIFAHTDVRQGMAVKLQDYCDPHHLIREQEMPVCCCGPNYSCHRWSTEVFPQWQPRDGRSWSTYTQDDGSRIHDIYFAMQPFGIQIGEHPFIPPGAAIVEHNERVLCSIASVLPRADASYPFIDRVAPLTLHEAEMASIVLHETNGEESVGTIYAVMLEDGSVVLRTAEL